MTYLPEGRVTESESSRVISTSNLANDANSGPIDHGTFSSYCYIFFNFKSIDGQRSASYLSQFKNST